MVSALDSGSSGPGSGPGRGHCVVFLGKTFLRSRCLSLSRCDGLASHPGGSINTLSRFMLRKAEISAGLMGLLARRQ